MKKIIIADDHLVVREGLKLLLETNDDFIVIGEAINGVEAIELAKNLSPDIILMDLYMPILNGVEAIKKIKNLDMKIPIVVLTTFNEEKLMAEAVPLGIKGYLFKDTETESLFNTINKAINGETAISDEILKKVKDINTRKKLTNLEIDTLILISKGYSNKNIADEFNVSERTVKSRLTNIFNKLGVNNRSEALANSIKNNILNI